MTRLIALSLLLPLFMLTAHSEDDPARKPGWTLTFEDAFAGDALDLKKWNPRDPWERVRNNELQAYVAHAFEVKDGVLRIVAEEREALYDGAMRSYTSGMMTTYQKFDQQYGWFEIRCRVPKGQGLWPAFWLLPMPLGWPPEIDVFEILGHETQRIHFNHHFRGADGRRASDGGRWDGPDFGEDFHVIAAEWTPDFIAWYVDGEERFRSTVNIPQVPMYMLVNLAIGGNWPGSPDETTVFPAALEVDYVRVYEREANAANTH